jgi:UDP-glucose 4-epimerase
MTRHVNATLQLLEVAAARGVAHFVYTSSMAAYGNPLELPVKENSSLNPLSFYGAGKAATEHYVRLYSSSGMAHSILRPFSVYGPGQDLENLRQGMISIYLAQLIRSGHVVVKGSLDRFRDFVHIDDAVSAVVAVLESEATHGQTMNLCSGKAVSVREVVGSLLVCAGARWDVVEVVEDTPGDQFGMFGDNLLLRDLAGWEPKWEVKEGIADMWTKAKSLAPKDGND